MIDVIVRAVKNHGTKDDWLYDGYRTHNLFTLAGRVAVVTGGAKGIGVGIVDVLAEARQW
jgi:hypothetical protein